MTLEELRKVIPRAYDNLVHFEKFLERHYRDMQDIEFTIQNKVLYILQTRSGKRTAKAAVRIAVSMVQEGLITEREAILRIDPEQMTFFLHPMIDPKISTSGELPIQQKNSNFDLTILLDLDLSSECFGHGLAASAGAATGIVVFTCEESIEMHKRGFNSILCREQTSADDIGGLQVIHFYCLPIQDRHLLDMVF